MNRAEFEKIFYGHFRLTTEVFLVAQTPVKMTYGDKEGDYLKSTFQKYNTNKGFGVSWNKEYLPYTVERWISPRWRGRKNPNLQWIRKRGIEPRLDAFVAQYGGKWYER